MFFIDSLRAGQVHCLGYARETTPALDALARRGVLFERAVAPSGWSLPSFSAIFTSRPPPAHPGQELNHTLGKRCTTLAEIYATFGYRTAGFVAGGHLSGAFGFGRGFQTYRDRPHFGSLFHTVPAAIEWMRGRDPRPFFLFIQGYDLHAPYSVPLGAGEMYDPEYDGVVHRQGVLQLGNLGRVEAGVCYPGPEPTVGPPAIGLYGRLRQGLERIRRWCWVQRPWNDPEEAPQGIRLGAADVAHIVAHYDAGVTYADTWLGYFLEALKASGHEANTTVVVASDHGEELGEHGAFGHGRSLHDYLLHVPLVVAGPGAQAGRRIGNIVELVDLAPTLLELSGIRAHHAHQGRSIGSWLGPGPAPADDAERVAFSSRGGLLSARTRRWHLLIDGNALQLYDLSVDPTEQRDVSRRESTVAARLAGMARDWEERHRADPESQAAVLTDEERLLFRRHGYW